MINFSRASWPNLKILWHDHWGRDWLVGHHTCFLSFLGAWLDHTSQPLFKLYVARWLNSKQRMWTEVMPCPWRPPSLFLHVLSPIPWVDAEESKVLGGGEEPEDGKNLGPGIIPWTTTPVTRNTYVGLVHKQEIYFCNVKLLDWGLCFSIWRIPLQVPTIKWT